MTLKLADGFSPQTEADWRREADAASKGAPFEKLRTTTEDGFVLDPISFRRPSDQPDERPGFAPFTRGDTASGARFSGWGIRQPFADPDLNRTNAAILRDLERGVSEVQLELDGATRRGFDPDDGAVAQLAGQGGLPLASVDDLDLVLAGVLDDLAPIVLGGGIASVPQAALLIGLWQRRGRDLSAIEGSLGAAPLSAWASVGALPGGPGQALADVAALARWCAEHVPKARVARADEGPFHEAGASDAEGLGIVMAEAVATLKAFAEGGHDLAVGAGQMELSLRLGADVFAGIAKLRAARLLWTRLCEVAEVPTDAPRPALVARLGRRSLTKHDPWVNLLRGTAATFAAAVGGAKAFTLEPFDAVSGLPDELGRRMARNTQLILQEESHLGRVLDPAGGSGYLEERTEQLAAAAWGVLQAIEGEGGLAAALESGSLRARLDKTRAQRELAVDRRKRPLTGVSEFPDPTEARIERSQPDPEAVMAHAKERLDLCRKRLPALDPQRFSDSRIQASMDAAREGATLGLLQSALSAMQPVATIDPLPVVRLSEGFERLRDAVIDANPPPIHLANIGPLARHTARATFVQNMVGVAGFRAEHGPATTDASEATEAFKRTGARVAILCGADQDYAEHGEAFARAIREAGATRILLAGKPGDLQAALEAAGVQGHVALGMNVREALVGLLDAHDIAASNGDPR